MILAGEGLRCRANNNVDVVDFDGRRYLAWRSAPWHFASASARIQVASSGDGGLTWRHEHAIGLGRDVREPRLFVFDGRLHLFMFTAGRSWWRFEPDRIHVAVLGAGGWSSPTPISGEDHVLWRVRWLDDTPIMTVYRGAGALGRHTMAAPEVEVWTTSNGVSWHVAPDLPPPSPTGTETDLIRLGDGSLVGIVRLDGPHRYGSVVAVRRPGDSAWLTRQIPEKLDSPLLFEHDGAALLVARRTPAFGGRFDLGAHLGEPATMRLHEGIYAATAKRTALWLVDPVDVDVHHLLDLPGHGDTCFPALVREGDNEYRLFNYTSPLTGCDRPWIVGLFGPTEIYQATLHIDAPAKSDAVEATGSALPG